MTGRLPHTTNWEGVVAATCDAFGFGFVMQVAARVWRDRDPKGALVVGPCVSAVVECSHPGATPHCDWCCGAGWVTQKVAEAQRALADDGK